MIVSILNAVLLRVFGLLLTCSVALSWFSCKTNLGNERNPDNENRIDRSETKERNGLAIVNSDTLRRNREVWESRKITSYSFTMYFEVDAFESPASPVRIYVSDGKVVSIKPVNPNDKRPTHYYVGMDTVNVVFDAIGERLEADAEVYAEFDSVNGFPRTMDFRMKPSPKRLNWRYVRIEDFTVGSLKQ